MHKEGFVLFMHGVAEIKKAALIRSEGRLDKT